MCWSNTTARSNRGGKRGILLITTLLIIAFLTALTVGFITINRENLLFAMKVNESQAALHAAYAGVEYVEARMEQDQYFGTAGADNNGAGYLTQDKANTNGIQYDAFPDGEPDAYGKAGPFWNNGGYVLVPWTDPNLTVYETGNTVVGLLNNNDSHFQVHFYHFAGEACPTDSGVGIGSYSANGFTDDSIANGSASTWQHVQVAADLHSVNNLSSSTSMTVAGKVVPPYSAHILSVGYSHGVTRTVEAMLKRVFISNSSIVAGSNITMNVTNGTGAGNSLWTLASLYPYSNDVLAGAQGANGKFGYNPNGGNITTNADLKHVQFLNSFLGKAAGNAYALRPGTVSIAGTTYPSANTNNYVAVGPLVAGNPQITGTFYGSAPHTTPLPPKDLSASDFLTALEPPGTPPAWDSNGMTIPSSSPCWISGGIYAFQSNGGYGNVIQVYNFDGTFANKPGLKGLNTDTISCVGSGSSLAINGYKLMVPPGVNVIVGSSNTLQGNFMLTLDPNDSNLTLDPNDPNLPGNYDKNSQKYVLPSLAFGMAGSYHGNTAGIDQIGVPSPDNKIGFPSPGDTLQSPSSITIGGNLYVQGQIQGNGGAVVQSNTPAPASWAPWSSCPGPWACTQAGAEQTPAQGDSGDLYAESGSQLTRDANFSLLLYSEGSAGLNPVGGSFTNSLNSAMPDQTAFLNALNSAAGGSSTNKGTAGFWSSSVNSPLGEPLNNILDFGHDPNQLPYLLRSAANPAGINGLNLDNQLTGETIGGPWLNASQQAAALAYCNCTPTTNLTLYQYAAISNYATTGDSSWIQNAYKTPPASGSLDPVEYFIVSAVNQFGQQAYINQANSPGSTQTFGNYMAGNSVQTIFNPQDMTFPEGILYVKGAGGFSANKPPSQFAFQGALMASQGPISVGASSTPTQADFLYDPTAIENLYTPTAGYPVRVQWILEW